MSNRKSKAAPLKSESVITWKQREQIIQQALANHHAMPRPSLDLAAGPANAFAESVRQREEEKRRELHIREFIRDCGHSERCA